MTGVKADAGCPVHAAAMKRCLVVYFSWTGNTARVAKAIASRLSADIEEVVEVRPRTGSFAYLRSAMDAVFNRTPPLQSGIHDISEYDLVVIGCPVWAQKMAAPMRTWLTRHAGRIPHAAFFCTEGGAGGEKVLAQMSDFCGASTSAALVVTEAQLKSGAWRESADKFVDEARQAMNDLSEKHDAG